MNKTPLEVAGLVFGVLILSFLGAWLCVGGNGMEHAMATATDTIFDGGSSSTQSTQSTRHTSPNNGGNTNQHNNPNNPSTPSNLPSSITPSLPANNKGGKGPSQGPAWSKRYSTEYTEGIHNEMVVASGHGNSTYTAKPIPGYVFVYNGHSFGKFYSIKIKKNSTFNSVYYGASPYGITFIEAPIHQADNPDFHPSEIYSDL